MPGFLNQNCSYELWTTLRGSIVQLGAFGEWWTGGKWGRTQSGTTTGTFTFDKRAAQASQATAACCLALSQMRTGVHEVVVARGGTEVWRGPIARISEGRSRVEVKAYDRSVWFRDWRTVPQPFDMQADLADLWSAIAQMAMAPDGAGLTLPPMPTVGVNGRRSIQPGRKPAGADIDELSRSGVTWTMVAGDLIPGATVKARAPILMQEDSFTDELLVVEDLEAWGSRVWVTGDGQTVAVAGGVTSDGLLKDKVVAEKSITDAISAQWRAERERENLGFDRPPTTLVVPPNAGLADDAPVTIADLVPGQRFQVYVPSYCRSAAVTGKFTLTAMDVQLTKSGQGMTEKVQVTMVPEQTA